MKNSLRRIVGLVAGLALIWLVAAQLRIAGVGTGLREAGESSREEEAEPREVSSQKGNAANELAIGSRAADDAVLEIPLNPLYEFDFESRESLYKLRRELVGRQKSLLASGYEPSKSVFGLIEDKKPWWGLRGMYGLGAGERSIEGPSEESRFFANPFLLVGVEETVAISARGRDILTESAYPKVQSIKWFPSQNLIRVRYSISAFRNFLEKLSDINPEYGKLALAAYNARDFGFRFLRFDEAASANVTFTGVDDRPYLVRQFIHCGKSCGYPGNCNNASPRQPEFEFMVDNLPAKIRLLLTGDEAADDDYYMYEEILFSRD